MVREKSPNTPLRVQTLLLAHLSVRTFSGIAHRACIRWFSLVPRFTTGSFPQSLRLTDP